METNTDLKMIHFSDVEAQQIKWLWYPFIPYGKLSILQGDPGDGKSTLILNVAARLSRGEKLEEDMDIEAPVNIIYQTAEDGLADTVKPRLEAANADCSRISIIDESAKSVSMSDDRIEEAIRKENAKLLILDPIQAYLGGSTDMNRANEAREITKKLGSVAERTGCAIVLIGHMNKGSGSKAAYRGMVPKANKLEAAKKFLREYAGTKSTVLSTEIIEQAMQEGISKRTLETAKKELGIRAKRINNNWYWELNGDK